MKQLKLFKDPNKKEFGSSLNLGIRKEQRPLSLKTPMHLILKSEVILQHGGFKRIEAKIYKEIHSFAEHFGIQIFNLAIHTRIVAWGRDFETVNTYITKNKFESEGKIHYFEALQNNRPS